MHGDVEDGDAAGAQGPLDLGGEAVRVERVVEDVGELEVEGGVGEGLGVEVPPDDERRGRGEVDADGAGDPDLAMEILYCCCGGGAAPPMVAARAPAAPVARSPATAAASRRVPCGGGADGGSAPWSSGGAGGTLSLGGRRGLNRGFGTLSWNRVFSPLANRNKQPKTKPN